MPPVTPVIEPKKSIGPIIGIIVIVILLILGGLYIWNDRMRTPGNDTIPLSETESTVPAQIDEVSSIESDLEGGGELEIDLSDLDTI